MKPERSADAFKRKKPWRVRIDTGLRNDNGAKIYKQAFGATAAEAKEEAKKMLLDPRTTFKDDQGNQVNFFNDIKIRAENLRNKQMINAQRGMLE